MTGGIGHRETGTFGIQKNISSGKFTKFSQITETSLFGEHEMLDYKILQIHFTCKQENICLTEIATMYREVSKTWLHKLVGIFPLEEKEQSLVVTR